MLDIFIDYAKDEKAAIIECMHQLGYFEGDTAIDDTVKKAFEPLCTQVNEITTAESFDDVEAK